MQLNRQAYSQLELWKANKKRKPLIIRGARQVGKTTLIRQFSKTYKYSILLNLELESDLKYFQNYTEIHSIVEALFIQNNITSSEKSQTLLFIDEIQESPEAIALLRYFYEMVPELHVIAAGSLLEHAISKVKSFPVGRVQMLHLSPLNFIEFLDAIGHTAALEQLSSIPVSIPANQVLKDLFHTYVIIGGMPEVVQEYADTGSISGLTSIYESIWETYKNDVEKYASNATESRVIKHIMSTAHLFVDQRIKYQNFGNSNYRSREVSEAFRNLNDAKIIRLVLPTTDVQTPIKPDVRKSPRMQFLDTGIINYELKIQADMLAMDDLNNAYKGAIIPHVIYQELLSIETTKASLPNFWVREKKFSSAEVDIVIQHKGLVFPIEIKSGKSGTLKSLHQFIEAANHPYAIRMYAGEFSIESHSTDSGKSYFLMNLPYYLGTKLFDYLDYFMKSYPLSKT
ncbi:MAG: ATP-binding protein [Fluviicola sp.]